MAKLVVCRTRILNFGRPRPPVCARNSILLASNTYSTSRSCGSQYSLQRAGHALKEPGNCTEARQPQPPTCMSRGHTCVACLSSVNASKQCTVLGVSSDSSASTVGVLTADFKAGALEILTKAASLAIGELQADPYSTITDIAAAATVSEQHLMQALLQEPRLLQLLGQYMAVNRGATANQAMQAIQEKLCYSYHIGDYDSAELQPTDGLLHALSAALGISRRLDLPEVSWYALLWDLMAADEATSAHENLLGAKLYSADLSDKLEQIMAEAAPKDAPTVSSAPPIKQAELKSAAAPDNKSVPAASVQQQGTDSVSSTSDSQCASMLDAVLHQALADAATQPQESKPDKVLLTVSAAITSAAHSGFQPDNSWMQKAWEALDNALKSGYASQLTKEQVVAEAALGDCCVHHFSPFQLAEVVIAAVPALTVMSASQLKLYLAALVRLQQHESSLDREQQGKLRMLHSVLETAVMPTLLSVMAAAGMDSEDKEAEAAIGDVLASMKELRIPVTADALLQFNQLLPKVKLGAKQGQLASVLDFLAHQQMHSKKQVGVYLASSMSAASDVYK